MNRKTPMLQGNPVDHDTDTMIDELFELQTVLNRAFLKYQGRKGAMAGTLASMLNGMSHALAGIPTNAFRQIAIDNQKG